jgi:hypothetical protein
MNDEDFTIDGEPSRKVRVHDVRDGRDLGVIAEYEDEDAFLASHHARLDKSEHVLVRKLREGPKWVRVGEYAKILRERKRG